MLARIRPVRTGAADEPSVGILLDVDREYRAKAQADQLKKIAPKRFNPKGEAWLPILHTRRGPWHFTALFSNTARAHELDKVRDWVVIYFHEDSGGEAQRTVITAARGPLAGLRIVRGRERECLAVYEHDPLGDQREMNPGSAKQGGD
jgi:putative hydrolase